MRHREPYVRMFCEAGRKRRGGDWTVTEKTNAVRQGPIKLPRVLWGFDA